MENNVITKIKTLLKEYGFISETPEFQSSNFADLVLADGNVLMVNGEVVVGAEVMVVTENGELPAPNGEYILEDGRIIVILDGLISEIKEAEEVVEPVVEPVEPEQMSNETMNELLDLFTQFVTSVNEKMNSIEMSVNTLNTEFQSFRKEPATKPIKQKKVETPVNKHDEFINAVIQMRNKK